MPGHSLYESPAEFRIAKCQLHGVLVEVRGSGVLLIGESGVGKTAAAMELLRRGHFFVADDAVQIFHRGEHFFGGAPHMTRSLIHIRGTGISNAADFLDPTALRDECRIDVCVEILEADRSSTIGRTQEMLEHRVPFFRIEAGLPGSVADRVETIVREYAVPLVQ